MGEVSSKTIRAADVKYQLQLCALYHYPHKHTHTLTNKLVEVLFFFFLLGLGAAVYTLTHSHTAQHALTQHTAIYGGLLMRLVFALYPSFSLSLTPIYPSTMDIPCRCILKYAIGVSENMQISSQLWLLNLNVGQNCLFFMKDSRGRNIRCLRIVRLTKRSYSSIRLLI